MGRIAVNDSCLRPTLEYLLPAWEEDPSRRPRLERFVREQGPRFQRFASIVNENAAWSQGWGQEPDAELADPFVTSIDSRHTPREARASARWRWICELACERDRIWIFADAGLEGPWLADGDERPWGFRTPTLLDVMGKFLIQSIARWIAFERNLSVAMLDLVLERLQEQDVAKTAAGILEAVVAAFAGLIEADRATFDRVADLVLLRVIAPGGQTARFAPLT